MSTPSGTPDPHDPPGPDATPEQDALVRGLLGSLRADDPPMPEHVAARLDAALAEEQRSASAAAGAAGTGLRAAEDPAEDPAGGTGTPTVTVLPQQRRRPDRSTTALQWLVGAAAAVLVVGGVGAVVSGTFGGTSADTAASGALAEQAQERVVATGTTYGKDTLAEQVRAFVADPSSVPDQGSAPATSPTVGSDSTDTTASPEVSAPGEDPPATLTSSALTGCVEQLAGTPGVEPVLVDQAVYEGRSALVVVLVTTGDPSTLDIFVVSPDCTRDSGDVLEFQRVPAP